MKNNKSYKGWLAISAVVALCSTATVQAETQTSAPQGGNTPQTVKNDKLSLVMKSTEGYGAGQYQ